MMRRESGKFWGLARCPHCDGGRQPWWESDFDTLNHILSGVVEHKMSKIYFKHIGGQRMKHPPDRERCA